MSRTIVGWVLGVSQFWIRGNKEKRVSIDGPNVNIGLGRIK